VACDALDHDPEKWRPVFRKDHAPPKSVMEAGFPKRSCSTKSMIRKSGGRFSEKIMLHQKHDPEKWRPVFPKRSCSTKKPERQSIQSKSIAIWEPPFLSAKRGREGHQKSFMSRH
jgi:hypothetical protein